MDLREHFLVIWRRRWIVLAASLVVAGVVYGATAIQHPVYQATAQLRVVPGQSPAGGTQSQDDLFLADTYAQLAMTRPVVAQAARSANVGMDESTAASRLSVKASTDVGFITVTASGPSTSAATALGSNEVTALTSTVTTQQQASFQQQQAAVQNTISSLTSKLRSAPPGSSEATALNTQLQALYQVVASRESQSVDQLAVVAPAHASSAPMSPKPKQDAVLAFVTALVVDSELVVAFEFLSDRFRGERVEEEIRRLTGLPVLAQVPEGSAREVIEAFRTLRSNLLFLESTSPLRTAAVVSSDQAAGKSFVCVNLASSVAELGVRVVLVDGDMRSPVLHERLWVHRAPGLSEVLLGRELLTTLRETKGMNNLVVLPAGEPAADPPGLIAGELRTRVLGPLLQEPDLAKELVVIDTPSEALFPDAVTIAAQCDATILVIDLRRSHRRATRQAAERLQRVNARLVGVVVNRAAAPSYRYRNRDVAVRQA